MPKLVLASSFELLNDSAVLTRRQQTYHYTHVSGSRNTASCADYYFCGFTIHTSMGFSRGMPPRLNPVPWGPAWDCKTSVPQADSSAGRACGFLKFCGLNPRGSFLPVPGPSIASVHLPPACAAPEEAEESFFSTKASSIPCLPP